MAVITEGDRGLANRGTGDASTTAVEGIKEQAIIGVVAGVRGGLENVMNPMGIQQAQAEQTEAYELQRRGQFGRAVATAAGIQEFYDLYKEAEAIEISQTEKAVLIAGQAAGFNQLVEVISGTDRAGRRLEGFERFVVAADSASRLFSTLMTVVGRVGRGGVKPRGGKPFSVQPDASPAVAAKSRPRVASPSTKAPAETPMLGREVIEHEDQIAKAAKQRVRGTVGSVQAAAPPAKQAQRGLSQSAPKRSSGQHAEVHDRPQVAGRLNSKSLEERIATAEEDLERAREKTSAYFKQREAAGRSRKGGPKKAIDNAKERLWILKRQQAYPDRQLLQNCQFRGVRLPNGDLKTVKTIVKKGRGPDFIEIDGNKALLGELKSEWELTKSLSGGPGTTSGGSTAIASGSKLSGQLDIEARLLSYAQRINGKLVIRGYDVKTGLRVEGEFEPSQITRALFSATSGWGIGSEWAQ